MDDVTDQPRDAPVEPDGGSEDVPTGDEAHAAEPPADESGAGEAPPAAPVVADASRRVPIGIRVLHLLGLSAFAIAQPLFVKIGNNATFFVAHHVDGMRIIYWAFALLLLPPAVLVVVTVLPGLVSRRLGWVLHASAVGALAAIAITAPIVTDHELSTASALVVALLVAIGFGVAYALVSWLRSAVTFASTVAPIAFLFVFLFATPVNNLVFSSSDAAVAKITSSRTPIVVIGFDEFALGAIEKPDGTIDAQRYPGFARLAGLSNWYPNMTGIAPGTQIAYPGILTGSYTSYTGVPDYHYYPHNLFTLFGGTHKMQVYETLTQLCPPGLCRNTSSQEDTACRGRRVVAKDTAIVLFDTILPTRTAKDLGVPTLNDRWCDFSHPEANPIPADEPGAKKPGRPSAAATAAAVDAALSQNQEARFETLLGTMKAGLPPTLWYLHAALPHVPWQFLPDGTMYPGGGVPGLNLTSGQWNSNTYLVRLEQQRMLLQLQFSDHLVSQLLDTMQRTGLLDKSLLVVTADHGVAFDTSGYRREPHCSPKNKPVCDPQNMHEIVPVPLFVKTPFQKTGRVDTRLASSLDIVPTIADAMHTKLPWSVDGHSLLDPKYRRTFRPYESKAGTVHLPNDLGVTALSKQIYATFGPPGGADDLYAWGPDRALVGTAVSAHPAGGAVSGARVDADTATSFAKVDRSSGFLPARFTATVHGLAPGARVAVSLNGTIAAAGQVFDFDGHDQIDVMLTPRLLRDGANDVRVFAIRGAALDPVAGPPAGG